MIEKSMKIGELLAQYPEKASVLGAAGMGCLGCPAAQELSAELNK